MAEDVCKTLKQVFRENGIDDPDQALIDLKVSKLFCVLFRPLLIQTPALSNLVYTLLTL